MGSVRSLYTTGDNDPEIDPVQFYRHYLYCDACGSFDLQSLQTPRDEARKRKRRRLAQIAILSSMLVVVSGWRALNLVPSLPVLAFLPVGIALLLVFRGSLVWSISGHDISLAARWLFFTLALALFLVVAALDWLAAELHWPLRGLPIGAIALAGSLIWRWLLRPKIELFGLRCAGCDAAYRHGSPFFTDLEANPRGLLLGDVPHPLGVSPFAKGEYVGPAPVERPHSRIPD